jgi:hypothetical protein
LHSLVLRLPHGFFWHPGDLADRAHADKRWLSGHIILDIKRCNGYPDLNCIPLK